MNKYQGSVSYLGQGQQDAWLCWACYEYNNYNPKSLAVLDPGLALTFGEPGLHGDMRLNNLRWIGSFWWRFTYTSFLTRQFIKSKYLLKRVVKRFFFNV